MSIVAMSNPCASANKQQFLDNGNGTVSNQVNGLVWQQTPDWQTREWSAAITYCTNLTLAGKKDWRLPTLKELSTLIDTTRSAPAIDTTYFMMTQGMRYWTVSTYDDNPELKCFVYFYNGTKACSDKSNEFLVRCVRNAP